MTRHPLVRGLTGLAVGFTGAFVTIQAVERVGASEYIETEVGEPDFNEYCSANGVSYSATLSVTDADGWRCVGLVDGTYDRRAVDVDDVCRRQFGDTTYAVAADPSDPGSWSCVERHR